MATFMLTSVEALRYASANPERLVQWRPVNQGPEHRALFLRPEVETAIRSRDFWTPLPRERENGPFDRRLRLMMLLDRWVGGEPIAVNREIKPLTPREEGLWELRSTYSVGMRLIGMIPARSIFVGFGVHRRDALGSGGSAEWDAVCASARSGWRDVFAGSKSLTCPGELTAESAMEFWDDRER